MFGFLRNLHLRFFSQPAQNCSDLQVTVVPVSHVHLSVGDIVFHPIRHEPTPVLAVGERVWLFVAADEHAKPDAEVHEVIQGSHEYKLFKCMRPMYRGAFIRKELSVEIDNTSEIERKTMVVPVSSLRKMTQEEISEYDRKRISRVSEADEVIELPDALIVDLQPKLAVQKE